MFDIEHVGSDPHHRDSVNPAKVSKTVNSGGYTQSPNIQPQTSRITQPDRAVGPKTDADDGRSNSKEEWPVVLRTTGYDCRSASDENHALKNDGKAAIWFELVNR